MEKRKKESEPSTSGCGTKRLKRDSTETNTCANGGPIQQTIPQMFFSQKPVQKVVCPVCAAKLSVTIINDHLDNLCLVKECQEDDEKDIAVDKPEDNAVASGYASTSSFCKEDTKKTYSKGECEGKNKQECQSSSVLLSEEMELQSTRISISLPELKQKPLLKIECQIYGENEKFSTEGALTSKYFNIKLSSPTKSTSPISSSSNRLVEKPTNQSENEISSINTDSSNFIPKSKDKNVYTEQNQLEMNRTASTSCLTGDCETSSSQFPSKRFSRISPAKPAKVKIYANPLSTPPRSHASADSVGSGRGLNLSSRVKVELFPDQNQWGKNVQTNANASEQYSSIQLASNNSQRTSSSLNDQIKHFSRLTDNPKSQHDITIKKEAPSQSNPLVKYKNISPAKPAKVKIFSSPLSSPPRTQMIRNTNCESMSQKVNDSSSHGGILNNSQESLVPSSSESGNTFFSGSHDSLYCTLETSPTGSQEMSSQSKLINGSHPEPQDTFSFQHASGSNNSQNSQSSSTSSIFLTADSTVDIPPHQIIPGFGQEFTSPKKIETRRKSVNSPYKHDGVPYYLANFKLIMNTVLSNTDDKSLFNKSDLGFFEDFSNLSVPSQQLYVRLYNRKHAWLRVSKLEYKEIAADLGPAITELINAGFFMNENHLKEPEEILNLLQAPELRELAKSFKVPQRKNLVQALLIHGRKQMSVLGRGLMTEISKSAKRILAKCIKLNPEPKVVMSRLMLLFSITSDHEEEDRSSNRQTAMQTMLMADMGRMKFAKYKVERPHKIFFSRDELIRYETAHKYEADIIAAMAKNDYDSSFNIFEKAQDEHKSIKNTKIIRYDKSLPTFLRRYTALWVYTRITYLGVEILQKKSCYDDAVTLLRQLLNQTVYRHEKRGQWWDRLALNLDYHLKKPKEALDAIKQGLADKKVKLADRLALQQRAEKICGSSAGNPLRKELNSLRLIQYPEAPKVEIMGRILPHAQEGRNNVFVRSVTSANGDISDVVCGVEQVALAHYRECGYNEGIHAEGSSMCTLIFILFWDIVFTEGVPDVFRNQFQAAPLDLRTLDFYLNRQELIEARLEQIKQTDSETLGNMLQDKWDTVYGEFCAGVNWQTFRDLDNAKSLLLCFGGEFLSTVAKRVLKDHEHFRAGMPDLTVWNTSDNTFKLVEVKGPGDRLSQKQVIWLDFFLKHGVQAELTL
ncbi:fanconi-associated nuclease 1-like isoform X2 [Anneissia japonica]|uniref:fanconi-associated nuclease 1-like isoform X2 n=1 Tax=Anneissia japonica TaxID=1529436 RepID=UPI0014258BF8|nr:fanconi-associated nuclease 1-like isoform X2 [Anneissia japonica]